MRIVAGRAVINSPTISSKPMGMHASISAGIVRRKMPTFFAPEQTSGDAPVFLSLRFRKERRRVCEEVRSTKETEMNTFKINSDEATEA
jgi:hypothetical protein